MSGMAIWVQGQRLGRVGLLAAGLALLGCNGTGAPPVPSSGPASAPSPATEREASPSSASQSGLPLGKVVLKAPPRAPLELSVEIAETNQSRQMGLMFREQLGDDEGMFFVFDASRQQRFWMRNTLIPLDMFFIDANFVVVGVVENAEPQTDTPRFVDGESQYVLEVNGGFAKEHGFGAGTEVEFTRADAAAEEETP